MTAREPVTAVVHVATTPDMETRARIWNEGYGAAVAQGLADDPTLAEEWLADREVAAAAAALDEVERAGRRKLNGQPTFAFRDGVLSMLRVVADVRAGTTTSGGSAS